MTTRRLTALKISSADKHRATVCLIALILAGCGAHERNAPSNEQVREAVTAALPPYLTTASVETEPLALGPDEVKVNFKAAVAPKEDLFVADRQVAGEPGFLLLKPAQTAGSKTTLYGSLLAQHTVDHWTLSAPDIPEGLERFGRPRASFTGQAYVTGSPEVERALQAIAAHDAEVEKQRQAQEETARQTREAAAEQQRRDEQALKDKLARATAPGTRYLGTLTDPSSRAKQRVRLTFVEQTGTLLRAEATNPDQPADHRSLSGELVLKPQVDEFMNVPRAYPIQLAASDKAPSRPNGQWLFYSFSRGPLSVMPTEDGGLEGESIIGQHYLVHLQREP